MSTSQKTMKPYTHTISLFSFITLSYMGLWAEVPNVVILYADDMGVADVSYGDPDAKIQTPNLDRLASQGMTFTDGHSSSGIRTQSRFALLTGQHHWRRFHGIVGAFGGTVFKQDDVTIAKMFRKKGYRTGCFGKWHLGDAAGRYPTDQGFDEWYGIPNSSDQAFWPDSDSFQEDSGVAFTRVMSSNKGEEPKSLDIYDRNKRRLIDREITTKALEFIDRQSKQKKPFFTYLPYTQTHEPVDAHPDFKGSTGNGSFADVLAQTDSYVGEILSKLKDLNIAENTIVIFTSDNGREGVKRSFGFTGPWRGSMFSPYEGSLRVPFLIRYPKEIPSGKISNEIVHIIDLFPTLAKWSGASLPQDRILDGVDQTSFFSGKINKSSRETVLIYVGNELFGVKWRNWKMLLKEIARNGSYAIQNLAYPSIYNLIIDPKEEEPEKFYLDDTWVEVPLWNAIAEHENSLEKDSGASD